LCVYQTILFIYFKTFILTFHFNIKYAERYREREREREEWDGDDGSTTTHAMPWPWDYTSEKIGCCKSTGAAALLNRCLCIESRKYVYPL
jgi:hypothetical protein